MFDPPSKNQFSLNPDHDYVIVKITQRFVMFTFANSYSICTFPDMFYKALNNSGHVRRRLSDFQCPS